MTETKKKPNCSITLEILGQKWTQTGKDIADALSKFDISWEQIKGKGELQVTLGKKNYTKLFNMVQLRRIFVNKIARMLWAKRLNLIIEGK